ncbi:MAG TPA: TetR/AcrR family transcriptional regulator [Kiloniellales bacterium]|jgi:AcrR family transcriptional regulator
MAGLRARQKADREQRILAAATALFREIGYERTKIESIAAHAEVSTGTVYNYYENKGDLLVAIVSMEVNEVLNAGSRLVANPPRNVELAVNRLMSIYLDHSLVYLSKQMWRHAMAISTQQPETRFGRTYQELDLLLTSQVCSLIARLQKEGVVRVDVDAKAVGEMLFNNANNMFIMFVKNKTMSLKMLRRAIARQNAPLVAAIRSA